MTGANAVGLWIAVAGMGFYHGISPGMGWPLAVSAALFQRRASALLRPLLAMGAGHLAAIGLVLLPFTVVQWIGTRALAIRIGAGLLAVAFGLFLLIRARHPRMLAHIRPDQLLLWAFVVATAHGAGLMLVPIYLGIADDQHMHHMGSALGGLRTAAFVCMLHTLAMVASGGVLAWLVYRYLGLQFLRKSWFNLERLWAISLVVTGAVGALSA